MNSLTPATNTIPADRSVEGILRSLLPGMTITSSHDHATGTLKIQASLKLQSFAPIAQDEYIEQEYRIDEHLMARAHSMSNIAEMYAETIRARMGDAINERMQPNPEIRALMNVAGYACRFNMEYGFFQVWKAGADKNVPQPRTDIDQEATIEEWRSMLSTLVEIERIEREHPGLRVSSTRTYNERSSKRARQVEAAKMNEDYLRPGAIIRTPPPPFSPEGPFNIAQDIAYQKERHELMRRLLAKGVLPADAARLLR